VTSSYTESSSDFIIDKSIDELAECHGSEIFSRSFGFGERAHASGEIFAALSERELQDMGTCWSSIAYEISKPFWRP